MYVRRVIPTEGFFVRLREPDLSSRTWDCFRVRFDSDDEFTQGQEGTTAPLVPNGARLIARRPL